MLEEGPLIKQLLQRIQNLAAGGRDAFDPSVFNDPLATQTDWVPAKSGGANFRTHNLVTVSPDRLEFRASIAAKLFGMLFLLAGLGVMVGFSAVNIQSGRAAFNMETVFPVIFGAIFTCVGAAVLYFFTQPVVFDRKKGFFWKGRTAPDEVLRKDSIKHFAELDRIHALQLLSEYCRGNKSSYYSYEINLVLTDGNRINVVDHGNAQKIREQAETIAEFLKKPVWDAI